MKNLCIQFALWILRKCGHELPVVTQFRDVVDDAVIMKARELIAHMAAHSDKSGEWRRAQVYRALINSFPDMPKRKLGFALEVAVLESGRV
jgi:hypothetical protein